MLDEASIDRQLRKEEKFSPPYCPNRNCKFHPLVVHERFWIRDGVKPLKRFPYAQQRFRCKACDRTFCFSTFQIHYRQKVWGLNFTIFQHHRIGVSMRETARIIGHSECLVRVRRRNLSRQALLKHALFSAEKRIEEPLVYDGLENFSYSQFDPNNLNHAVGKRTLFTYDFNLSPLNRKGRMSERQIKKKALLEKKHGVYPRNAIRISTKKIFERLFERSKNLVIFSDKHYQYRRVVEIDLKEKKIEHITISSKVTRNYQNPLFPVNNVDLQARHNLAAYKRETIAFSKHTIAMQDSFILYLSYRNYMRPKFWGTHRSDPLCSKRSPAMELKITDKILTFQEFFSPRILPTQVKLHQEWRNLYFRRDPFSRRPIKAFA